MATLCRVLILRKRKSISKTRKLIGEFEKEEKNLKKDKKDKKDDKAYNFLDLSEEEDKKPQSKTNKVEHEEVNFLD